MKKLLISLFMFTHLISVIGQNISPIERTIGKLHISIDPRMELLSTIQILSSYQNIVRISGYSEDIRDYFGSNSSSRAVKITDELLNNQKFSYDAPVALMLHLNQVPDLKPQIPYSAYLLRRGGGKEKLDEYCSAIQQFAIESHFDEFWKNKQEFYNKILDLTVSELGNENLIKVLEDYFNETQNSYNIIISPSFRGGYGPSLPGSNGKLDIYSCISTTSIKDGIPYLSKEALIYYVWHEFGHSFVNPETEKYPERIRATEKLFNPIVQEMARMAYGDWTTCVNEHIIRAVNIRLRSLTSNQASIYNLVNQEKANRFIYIEPLERKLAVYESLKEKNRITFSDFFPAMIDVLDSLLKTDYEKLAEVKFFGPINSVMTGQNLAYIFPTNDNDSASLKVAQDYVKTIFNRFKRPGSIMIPDTMALRTNLFNYGLMVYGTLESNLFLLKYKKLYPFRLENQILFAGKEYNNKKIKFITCLPSPLNPLKGMAIYTALSNTNIQDINRVFHGPEDYIIFLNKDTILDKGFYDKTDDWKFKK
jgi:hypothetical protein